METRSKTSADAAKEEELQPPPTGADSLSLPSYKEYPAHYPFLNKLVYRNPKTCRSPSSSKALPETSCAAILSALKNLQEKIRRLELEKGNGEVSLQAMRARVSHPQRDRMTQKPSTSQTDSDGKPGGQSNCNQVLITHLAAAESRCVKLERQLDHMKRMLRNARAERTDLLKQQASMESARSAGQQPDIAGEHAHLEKLERLEQEYLRLTRTQNQAEAKIHQLELKLEEEEHQRKLVQDKANQLQSGLEASRILGQSASPRPSTAPSREKKCDLKKSATQPHYRLNLRDVPFVTGTSVGGSHSVRANVQSVLSLLKQHQPHLCNNRVLSHRPRPDGGLRRHSDVSSSSSSSASGEELSELLQALQEELRLMSLEQDDLIRQLEVSISQQERKQLQREQERLLLKMERKGEQISKLYKHKTQIKKIRKEAHARRPSRSEASTRGCPARTVDLKPGERSKRNLRLLREMKALQTSLRS